MYPVAKRRTQVPLAQLAWTAALATVAQADAQTPLANPCGVAPATGLLATTKRAGLIDLYDFRA
jgi:hypothetical protein